LVFSRGPGTFVDIGANLGLYSLLARQLGADALLFEPEPTHASLLQRDAVHVGTIAEFALGDCPGRAMLNVGDVRHSGASSLSSSAASGKDTIYAGAVEVDVHTFDAYAESAGVDLAAVRLIKVDVEGHEASTIRGMLGYLARPD